MAIVDYQNESGWMRRVRVKSKHDDPRKGIPIDIFGVLDERLSDTPVTFRKEFYDRLWSLDLIEPHHLQHKDATRKFRQALNSAIACDSTNSIRYVLEQTQDDNHKQYDESS